MTLVRKHHLLVAALAASVAVPSAAWASSGDSTPPALVSVATAVDSPLLGGDRVAIRYDADEPGSGLRDVWIHFATDTGATFYLYDGDGDGLAEGTLSEHAASGTYELSRVELVDAVNNRAVYQRDGYLWLQPGGDSTHNIDLSPGDFTVQNDQGDELPPQLRGVAAETASVTAGDRVAIRYDADEPGSGLRDVWIHFATDTGATFYLYDGDGDGLAEGTLSEHAASGTYELSRVELVDAVNNRAVYQRDGYLWLQPGGDSTHNIDLSPGDFTVQNDQGDDELPREKRADNASQQGATKRTQSERWPQ